MSKSPSKFSPILARFREHVEWDVDPEPEQAIKIRLPIAALLVVIYCVPWSGEQELIYTFFSFPGILFLNHLIMGMVIVLAIIKRPGISPVRRISGISLDIISLSAVMFMATEKTLPLFVMYLWVIHGNGFRYGVNYLYITAGISLLGFTPAIVWGSYWQTNLSIGISLLIILFILPLYSAFLLKKLHAAIASAKQANEAKSRFLANMSHELRTPLNGVIGMGELLRETSLSFKQHELVNSMHSSANTLLDLIENVLDISKIEAGKLIISSNPFDLHALVNSVRYMLSPLGERKGLTVSCNIDSGTPFSLNGDKNHIRQVLINLFNNAIKFTDKGSVNLHVFRVGGSEHKPRIRFEITDTGIGIDQAVQQRIFENFTQADASSNRSYGGTGLGTTISRDLVELMGGCIGLESESGKGSNFWFELPFEVIPKTAEDLSSNKLLLLASEESASIIRPSLKDWSIEYDWVRSTARAFSLLVNNMKDHQDYEIIIVDQACMQDVNPTQFAQMVKSEKELESVSMVLINSSDTMIESNSINHYYITTLEEPEDKRLLFNAIHAAQSVHFDDSNIVTLAEHYSRQGGAKVLDILVAEDNRVNQQVVEGILKNAGHRVRLADSGEEALDILAFDLEHIDLLILDMNMPEKSGIDVVKALRFMDTGQSVPVIMLTADATPEAKEKSLSAGASIFLTKPVDARLLIEKVAILTRKVKNKRNQSPPVSDILNKNKSGIFDASPWFDEHVLRELSNLGDGLPFVENLINGFRHDGEKHIKALKQYEEDDFPAYRESLHALKGSATELGAKALVDICLKGESFKPYDMGSGEIKHLNREVENIFNLTVSAFREAISASSIPNPHKAD